MKNVQVLIAAVILSLVSLSFAQNSESSVFNFADASEIEGTYSQLVRGENTIAMELKTSGLEPKAPYTVWWVVFNNPQACSDACGEDDIFGEDGNMSLNEAASISILFADGAMSDGEGNGNFSGLLTENRPFGQVAAGPGLTDTQNAEVHLVVRSHGELDASLAYEQLSYGKHCADCVFADEQFAIHLAPEALAGN